VAGRNREERGSGLTIPKHKSRWQQAAYSSVFLLACGIQNINLAVNLIEGDLLAVAVRLGGVVFLNKIAIHELEGEG